MNRLLLTFTLISLYSLIVWAGPGRHYIFTIFISIPFPKAPPPAASKALPATFEILPATYEALPAASEAFSATSEALSAASEVLTAASYALSAASEALHSARGPPSCPISILASL